MQINSYEGSGRTLYVEFKCKRCGQSHFEPLKEVNERSGDHYGHIHQLKPPQDWSEIDYCFLLCENCTKAFAEFIKGGSGNG